MFKKRVLVSLIAGVAISYSGRCQEAQNFGPVPAASGAGNAVQNNLYDGSASINIPIYSTAIEGVPVSVGLSYNTKGIKVDQVASATGLGWSLSTGPTIHRIIHDFPDEVFITAYKYYSGPVKIPVPPSLGSWYNPPALPMPIDNKTAEAIDFYDYEADEFIADINGKAFSFYISKTGAVITVPKTELKIERVINGLIIGNTTMPDPTPPGHPFYTAPQINIGFIITDEIGNKYYFIKGDVHKEPLPKLNGPYAEGGFASQDYEVTDKWVIEKVVTYTGTAINYQYSQREVNYDLSASEMVSEALYGNIPPLIKYKKNTSKGYISYIDKIRINKSRYVTFNYADRIDLPATKALSSIKITSGYGGVVGSVAVFKNKCESNFTFNYSYFHTPDAVTSATDLPFSQTYSGSDKNIRLKLNSIFTDFGNTSEKFYEFSYNSIPLPSRLSIIQDLYGYYNGEIPQSPTPWPNLKTGIALHPFFGSSGSQLGISKASNISFSQAWSLAKVKNGKGAETQLFYEAHSGLGIPVGLNPPVQATNQATGDGLRLAVQVQTDGLVPENDIQTVYGYEGGEMFLPGGLIAQLYVSRAADGTNYPFNIYHNTFTSANMSVNGSNHGYSRVSVLRYKRYNSGPKTGQFGVLLGAAQYEFTNATTNLADYTNISTNLLKPANLNGDPANQFNLPYYAPPFTNKQYYRSWAMGLPVRTTIRDNANKISTITTTRYNVSDTYISGADFKSVRYNPDSVWADGLIISMASDIYYLSTGNLQLTACETRNYVSDNVYTSEKTNNTYDSHNNITKTSIQCSDGTYLENTNYYTYDWAGNPTAGSIVNTLNAQSVQSLVFTECRKKSASINKVIGASINGYNLINGIIRPVYSYSLVTKNGIDQTAYGTGGPASVNLQDATLGNPMRNFRLLNTVTNYDAFGNPREIKGLASDYNATFYNGLDGLAIANIANARMTECAFTGFDGFYEAKGTADDNKGNWDFDPAYILNGADENISKLSGKLIYKFPANNANAIITATGLNLQPGKDYMLTFWAKNDMPVIKNGGTLLNPLPVESALGGWYQYQIIFQPNSSGLSITPTGNTCYIDELRLHPVGAEMNTITYEPQFGIAAKCNENNKFIIYDYDDRGRVSSTRDHRGRVLSKTRYVTNGTD